MNMQARTRASAASSGLSLTLDELVRLESRKSYDLYRAGLAIAAGSASARLTLEIKDDCVFADDVAPLVKHALHRAFRQLVGATRTRLDDKEDEPKPERPRWSFDLERVAKDDPKPSYAVTFAFAGPAKTRGTLLVRSAEMDDPWRAEAEARGFAHELLLQAYAATRLWKLDAEALDAL